MELKFTPLIEELQKKIISIALRTEEPKMAILLEDKKVFFVDIEKGQILLPKTKEEKDVGGCMAETGERDVPEELQPENDVDRPRQEDSQGPSGEI